MSDNGKARQDLNNVRDLLINLELLLEVQKNKSEIETAEKMHIVKYNTNPYSELEFLFLSIIDKIDNLEKRVDSLRIVSDSY